MTATPEQQDFCCAVVEDGGEHTIRWLYTTCHDYWGRITELVTVLEAILRDSDAKILDSHRDDGWMALAKANGMGEVKP